MSDSDKAIFLAFNFHTKVRYVYLVVHISACCRPLEVLDMHSRLNEMKIDNQGPQLRKVTKYVFYNTSPFTFKTLLNDPGNIRINLETYLDSFSTNVQDIISKFKLRNQLDTMEEGNITYPLVEKFCSSQINLSPEPVKNSKGEILHDGLSNLGMGYVFEELIRKFNEENNEEAGEHFTPREIIKLMTHLIFEPIKDKIKDGTYLIYDPACGSGGMLTEAEHFAKELNKSARFNLYGQEVNPETYAICKADMLIKGEDPEKVAFGSTLSNDGFPHLEFDFMLSNPPFGKSWKLDFDTIVDKNGSSKEIIDPRFKIGVPRSSDGQLLFLCNMLSKMKSQSELGSRIASVHNGSSLFTGDAGSGESEIRKWIIENDYLECIIALPDGMFYNTEISTFIWVLSNKKETKRKDKVQLINATPFFSTMVRSMGKKSNELLDKHIQLITEEYLNFNENEVSKIFPTTEFYHKQIIIDRPLRLRVNVTEKRHAELKQLKEELDISEELIDLFEDFVGYQSDDFNDFQEKIEGELKKAKIKVSNKEMNTCFDHFSLRDSHAKPVIKSIQKGKIEYKPDIQLRNKEKVPFNTDIEDYFRNTVQPFADDAWWDKKKVSEGYQIHFMRYFSDKKLLDNTNDLRTTNLELEVKRVKYLKQVFEHDEISFSKLDQIESLFNSLYSSANNNSPLLSGVENSDYKPAQNPWFGNIPVHWKEMKAKWIFMSISQKGFPNEQLLSVTQHYGVIPRDEYEYRVVMPLGDLISFKLIEEGDFVISLRSFQGGIEYSENRGLISPAYTVLRNIIEIHKPYFKHVLKCESFIQSLNTAVTGIREGKNINFDDFGDIYLPVPPLDEQISIAKYLDGKLPLIREKSNLIDSQIKLLKSQRHALINEVVQGHDSTKPVNVG
jgi:type I restriction enzyme M protein